jgi:hypothetical protein
MEALNDSFVRVSMTLAASDETLTLEAIVKQEGQENLDTCAAIGHAFAIKYFERKHGNASRVNNRRENAMKEFEEEFSIDHYNADDDRDTGKPICAKIAAVLRSVAVERRTDYKEIVTKKEGDYKEMKRVANNKKSVKMDTLVRKHGIDGFNRIKHRQQAASMERKATEVGEDPEKVADFLNWRRLPTTESDRHGNPGGRRYDDPPPKDTLIRTPHTRISARHFGNTTTEVLYTDKGTMGEVLKTLLPRQEDTFNDVLNVRVQVRPDPADASTTHYQYVASGGHALSIRNVTIEDTTTNREYRVAHYCWIGSSLYYCSNDQQITVHLMLPKEYSRFEKWKGHGVVGNPGMNTTFYKLHQPNNLSNLKFIKARKEFEICLTHNVDAIQDLDTIVRKISADRLDRAAETAQAVAACVRDDRARINREKGLLRKAGDKNQGKSGNGFSDVK